VPVDEDVAPAADDEDDFFTASLRFTQNMEARPTQEGRREGGLTPLKIEIEKYLDLPRLANPKVDVLGWWKAQKCTFPLLAECARKYHCIPASSAPSERLFSKSGNLITQNRNSLNPKNVHMLLYLQEHLEKVKITKWDFDLMPQGSDEEPEPAGAGPTAGPTAGPN